MKWYYSVMGTHVHVRVFMNGANCGGLVFRTEEFRDIMESEGIRNTIRFIDERAPRVESTSAPEA